MTEQSKHPIISNTYTIKPGARFLGLFLLLILIVSCSTSFDDPSDTVERYLQAKVAGDAQTIRLLICAEMESLWAREANSFKIAGGAEIQELSCQSRATGGIVDCQGYIVANYGGEERKFPLGAFRVTYEGGEWRWCGESH